MVQEIGTKDMQRNGLKRGILLDTIINRLSRLSDKLVIVNRESGICCLRGYYSIPNTQVRVGQ